MANDIDEAIGANPVKNGTAVVGCLPTGPTAKFKNDDRVSNKPTKYDARFDDPRYYSGDAVS